MEEDPGLNSVELIKSTFLLRALRILVTRFSSDNNRLIDTGANSG